MTLLQLRTYDTFNTVNEMCTESTHPQTSEISVRLLCRTVPIIGKDETCREVMDKFKRDAEAPCMVYCQESGKPEGLIMREAFYRRTSGRFFREIYDPRPASYITNMNPMAVDISDPVSHLLQKALQRPESQFYDCVLVLEQDQLLGVLTVKDLLQLSTMMQIEAENKREYILDESSRHTYEIELSLSQVAEKANITRTKSERMQKWSQTGRTNLQQVSESYSGLVRDMEERASFVTELLKNAQNISSMTKQISELADHSSLLAINASIEAAHAGERGRGFQVVAGEVQNLSKQTRSLATDISSLLTYIQHLVQETATATNHNLTEIRACERIVTEGGEMFTQMEQVVLEVKDAGSQAYDMAEKAAIQVKRVREELAGMNESTSYDSNSESMSLLNY